MLIAHTYFFYLRDFLSKKKIRCLKSCGGTTHTLILAIFVRITHKWPLKKQQKLMELSAGLISMGCNAFDPLIMSSKTEQISNFMPFHALLMCVRIFRSLRYVKQTFHCKIMDYGTICLFQQSWHMKGLCQVLCFHFDGSEDAKYVRWERGSVPDEESVIVRKLE